MLKFRFQAIPFFFAGLAILSSCGKADQLSGPVIELVVPADGFKVELGKSLPLNPNIVNGDKTTFVWAINGETVSSNRLYTFIPTKVGNYNLQLKVSNEIGSDSKTIQVNAFSSKSPYISTIFDYQYGPGQHASLVPSNCKGEDFIGLPLSGTKQFTSLGGWGGYIIAGFDHPVKNGTGADFAIFAQPGAGSEPGVVFVMDDSNGDGKPNDGDWFEIKGSEYNHPETIRNYQVTYYKPNNKDNLSWKDNNGKSGILVPVYESSSWWWGGYGNKTEVVFSGVKLPDAYKNTSTQADVENWTLRSGLFTFGYAECYNNADYNFSLKANLLDISDAVDQSGQKVNLESISFIKVQSGIFQIAGWLNEVSTEISGAADLSLIEYTPN